MECRSIKTVPVNEINETRPDVRWIDVVIENGPKCVLAETANQRDDGADEADEVMDIV